LTGEAESLIPQITNFFERSSSALSQLAEAAAVAGDHDRAEAITTQITNASLRAAALGRLHARGHRW